MNERLDVLGRVIVALGLFIVPACDDSQDEPSQTADAAAAAADSGAKLRFRDKDGQISDGSVDAAAADAHVELEPSDRELLLACEAEEPCLLGFAQVTEGYRRATIHADRTACILEGLQERRPGRYLHETNSTWGNGHDQLHHVLIVRADGKALYARTRDTLHNRNEKALTPEPAQLCTLREPSYFSECVVAVREVKPNRMIEDLPWECAYGEEGTYPGELKWFESCEPAPATCE